MKQFTHLYLDDKGLKAVVAPDKRFYDNLSREIGEIESDVAYMIALKQAITEGVYFKDTTNTILQYYIATKTDKFEFNKPYPIPDGYEVKVKNGEWSQKLPTGSFIQYDEYAILVPKENVTPCPKCRTIDFIQTCHDMRCPLRGEEPQLKQQSTIEEAANVFSNGFQLWLSLEIVKALREGFIAGAKSDSAKEYWYEQFKQLES